MRKVINKITDSKEHKKVVMNELYATDITRMSAVHMLYLSFIQAKAKIQSGFKCKGIRPVMELCMQVFALNQLAEDQSALYETGFFKSGAAEILSESLKSALNRLRPHMVPLVEIMNSDLD